MAKKNNQKVLICWNPDASTNYIENQVKGSGYETVCCINFEALKERNWKKISYIIVLCELKWSNEVLKGAYSDMNGIKLAQHFRLTGVKIPIFFVSFLSRKIILAHHPDAEIICTPALKHGFAQLPAWRFDWSEALEALIINEKLKDAMEKYSDADKYKTSYISTELTDLELKYTQRRFCSIVGMLEHINHDISSCATKGALIEKLKVLKYADNRTHSHSKEDIDELEKKVNSIAEDDLKEEKYRQGIQENFKIICKQIKSSINGSSVDSRQQDGRKYCVLFIDEDYKTDMRIKELVKAMESQGFLITIEQTPRYDFRSLEGYGKGNRFDAVISDIEIKAKTDDNEVEELQYLGFNYIKWLQSSFDRIYIILSNVTRNLYNDVIFGNDNTKNVYPFQKDVYICSDAARQEFINKVKDLIDNKRNAGASGKKKGDFDKNSIPLKYFRNYINFFAEQSNYEKNKIPEQFKTYAEIKTHVEEKVTALEKLIKFTAPPSFLQLSANGTGEEYGNNFVYFIHYKVGPIGEKRTEKPKDDKYTSTLSNNFINTLIARRLLIYTLLKSENGNVAEVSTMFEGFQKQYPQTQYCFPSNISRESINGNKDNRNLFSEEEIAYIKQLLGE
ncbi:MAG: hypothetical protein LBD80_07755 [Tannerella sp.]|jgi:hypothetical protein|nr:hypothetical protein [Tannerella sp.]